jgi:PAS domain S-box-containing protein
MQQINSANFQKRFLFAFSIALFATPLIGGAVEIFLGVYTLQEILSAVVDFTIFYIIAVYALGVYGLHRLLKLYTHRLERGISMNDPSQWQPAARQLSRLNLYSILYILIYSQGGPFSVNYMITHESLRPFSTHQELLSYVTTLPTILIILFPFFFYLYDLLGSYLAPRGAVLNAMPIRMKVMVLGMVTPLLIDMVLILYFEDRTGYFNLETLILWIGLFSIATAGAHLTYRSFSRSLTPLEGPLTYKRSKALSNKDITPVSLDEMGLLAQGWKSLLSKYQQYQQALQNERNFADAIINNANAMVVVLDKKGRLVEFNDACEAVTGFDKVEVLGGYVWDHFIIPEEIDSVKAVFHDLSSHGFNSNHVNYWLAKDGRRRLISWSNSVMHNQAGDVENIISIGIDITDQRQAEEDLRTSQDTLAKAQAIAHIGHWDWNILTNGLEWSDETFRIFGLAPQQFEATYPAFLEYVHPDDRDVLSTAVAASLDNPDTPYSIEHRICRPDGSDRIVHERGQIYRDEFGKPVRMVGTVHDITESKIAEEKIKALNNELEQRVSERTIELEQANILLQDSFDSLQRTQKHLVESEKMAALGGLVAGIAHEINTPIGIGVTAASHLSMKIKEYQTLYENEALTRTDFEKLLKSSRDSAEILNTNLQRAAEMIRSFKQVAVDQSSEQARRFEMKEYLHEVLNSLHPRLRHGGYQLHVQCPDNFTINSYPGAISQVIANLVINSVVHGFDEEKGDIWIDVSRNDGQIIMAYRDNGKGIDKESLDRIFEPFYTTRRNQGGSGLGLHVLYNIVTQTLGGAVSVDSTPGHGVAFQITFPELGE